MPSALCHLTAEQFSGMLSNPENWVTFLLMVGFPCQERAQSSGVLWKEALSTSLINTWSGMTTHRDNQALGQVTHSLWEIDVLWVFKIHLTKS